jgi:hypothetical protein
MNGDRIIENILVEITNASIDEITKFTVHINDKLVHSVSEDFIGHKLTLEQIDLDSRDNLSELKILITGALPINQYWIINCIDEPKLLKKLYSNSGTQTFGSQHIKLNNYSSLYTKHWYSFWEKIEKYEFNLDSNKLSKIIQPFYYVGVTAKATNIIEFYSDLNSTNIVGKFSRNKTVTFILYKDSWYLVKSHLGLIGWIHEDSVFNNFSGLNWAN